MPSKNNIQQIMDILSKEYSIDEKTTLNRMRVQKNKDPFKILISCLLSLRARDENTEIVSKKLFKIADTPKRILALPMPKLKQTIFSSGHYNKKANALKHVSKEILERFHGKVPQTREELISIKHIGQKTANIVLNFAFDQEVIPVDVHVHVIANRLGLVRTKDANQTEIELMKILPKKYWQRINAIFVQFGREICITISPKCSICPVKYFCPRISVTRSR